MINSKFKVQSSKFNRSFTTFSSHERGFTLIELLVVLIVIATMGIIVLNIITSAFRGTSKTDVINKVRENGNYAISEISRTLKYNKSFDGASINGVSNWECDVLQSPPAPTPIPIQYKAVKTTSFDGITTIFSCEADTINANGASLMHHGPGGSVLISPGTCFFNCTKSNIADSPQVGINFTIISSNTNDTVENQAIIPFSVSIKIRN